MTLRRRVVLTTLSAAAATICILCLLLARAWALLHTKHAGFAGPRVVVDLPRDLGATEIVDRLASAGVVRHPGLVKGWLLVSGEDRGLRAGEYAFVGESTPLEVLDRLRRGDVLLHRVTVPEGLTLEEVAARMEAAGFGPVRSLLEAFRDGTPVREIDPNAPDLEGYLFPETYAFARGTPPRAVTRAMVQRFRQTVGPGFVARAAEVGLSPRQAVTLASLVEEETAVPDERPRIARVFHNRLRRGIPLQCDPTVLYALRRAGRPVARLLRSDLQFPSPWNTYRNRGLPPGPISSPGRASIEAVLRPADGDDLYFVASPSGGHHFSRDLPGHLRAVREWRRYAGSSR